MNESRWITLALIAATSTLAVTISQVAEARTRADKCTMGLNSEVTRVHCASGHSFNCEGVSCCSHEHQALTYQKLIDTGTTTEKKTGPSQKLYYSYKAYLCADHDEDPQTPNTCEWTFPAESQDGPNNNPTHFVVSWSLLDC